MHGPPNDLCSSLIVYGSYSPGGENHHFVESLPGTWKKGLIVATQLGEDEIAPRENDVIEAWKLSFADCQEQVKRRSPEYEARTLMLYERWSSLDRSMPDDLARDQMRWWPEGADHTGRKGMVVVNIYLPVKHFTHLKHRYDAIPPHLKRQPHDLWSQVKCGKQQYEPSVFKSLIKDANPDQFGDLFANLPDAKPFLDKLERFFRDQQRSEGRLLVDQNGKFHLYVVPLKRNAIPAATLTDLAAQDVAQRARLLRLSGFDSTANMLEKARFEFIVPPDDFDPSETDQYDIDTDCFDALSKCSGPEDHWFDCLKEACYGISASYNLQHWLVSEWRRTPIDFEPAYALWKGGGSYAIHEGVCSVYETNRSDS